MIKLDELPWGYKYCSECEGSGFFRNFRCIHCKGSGIVPVVKKDPMKVGTSTREELLKAAIDKPPTVRDAVFTEIDEKADDVVRALHAMGHPDADFSSWSEKRKGRYYRDVAMFKHALKAIKTGKI